jgi:putative hydrolase of the HAD superfamily
MTIPKMILFDYGQTLVSEGRFDGIAGTKAVLDKCVNLNSRNISIHKTRNL